ncbi:hypothetical protein C5473_18210 [Leptospira interrogans serovar Weerasinghe]|nr:hypothetical protein C5473_18210 [Leptospira interrogans serovar Weerasinghe]OOB98474.1 hypothetical protein B0192_10930 [Leptospira interrogans serovar Australis]
MNLVTYDSIHKNNTRTNLLQKLECRIYFKQSKLDAIFEDFHIFVKSTVNFQHYFYTSDS